MLKILDGGELREISGAKEGLKGSSGLYAVPEAPRHGAGGRQGPVDVENT